MFWTKPQYLTHPSADRNAGEAIHVVGEASYQSVLKKAAKQQDSGVEFDVALVAEPDNRFDKKAIRVDLLIGGKPHTVGYIASDETAKWHRILKTAPKNVTYTWPAELRAGKGKPVGIVFFARQ